MLNTIPLLETTDFPALKRTALTTLQVNLGYLCNLSCTHCHVNAGPNRTEQMDADTVQLIIDFIRHHDIKILDLTGGAPEMNPHFRSLVAQATKMGVEVIDRCNLMILLEEGYQDLPEFLARHNVTVTASLPCYLEDNVAKQRGKGVYQGSMQALQKLNSLGYGVEPSLKLNLVYNPIGTHLPPPQQTLESDYKKFLQEEHGVVFNELFTITNMPIQRFGSMLLSKGLYDEYMDLLRANFSHANLQTVMCKSLISVDYQGYVYDCDFNQMIDFAMPVMTAKQNDADNIHLSQLMHRNLEDQPIRTGDHCYACTAGQGSSCGGALS